LALPQRNSFSLINEGMDTMPMVNGEPHITVCICTFKRPLLLTKLLEHLVGQQTDGLFSYSVVIADNDPEQSGREVVSEFAAVVPLRTVYCTEPERNIAMARNKALQHASGDFVTFIDDDEYPSSDWLLNLYNTCVERGVAGVLGPVRPYFQQEPPSWVREGRFFDRPEHETGFVLAWEKCRTGNVLLRSSILRGVEEPFNPDFGTGGEDKDFFMRMTQAGCVFIWCNEAPAYELIPPSRWKRSFMFSRAFLRGKNILKHPIGRYRNIVTSLAAVPLYGLALPLMFLGGQAYFMKYAIKFCDHVGRLLALIGCSPVSGRQM
jgi:glycosyltransferase involved in cell wall biosynthesis